MVDGVLPVGLGGRPPLLTGGPDVVHAEEHHGARVRSGPTACQSVQDGNGCAGEDPVGPVGGLVQEVWGVGWLRLAPFSPDNPWGEVRSRASQCGQLG